MIDLILKRDALAKELRSLKGCEFNEENFNKFNKVIDLYHDVNRKLFTFELLKKLADIPLGETLEVLNDGRKIVKSNALTTVNGCGVRVIEPFKYSLVDVETGRIVCESDDLKDFKSHLLFKPELKVKENY